MNRWSCCWVICLAVAGPALSAGNTFDGTYTGKRVLTKGIDRTCPTEDDVSVIIHGESLTFSNSKLRGFIIGFEPRPDGSFSEVSTGIEGTTVQIDGHIVGDVLDADVTTTACQHHWHLTRG
jgi:hypothetical protein